jgi:hypothetical protein
MEMHHVGTERVLPIQEGGYVVDPFLHLGQAFPTRPQFEQAYLVAALAQAVHHRAHVGRDSACPQVSDSDMEDPHAATPRSGPIDPFSLFGIIPTSVCSGSTH